MRDFVVKIRAHTAMQFAAPVVAGLPAQSEPLLNWKLKQYAEHRRDSDPKDLRNDTDPPPVVPEIPKYPDLHEEAAPRWAALSAKARANDTDLIVPAAQRARYEAAFSRFASVFPDAFYISERGRYFPDDSRTKAGCSAPAITTSWAITATIFLWSSSSSMTTEKGNWIVCGTSSTTLRIFPRAPGRSTTSTRAEKFLAKATNPAQSAPPITP
jgi:hypothetical protein